MSQLTEVGNKTIAKNTIIVYVKLFVTTFVGLLSSRFVLQALGVSDFGLYNVVGSIIGMFAFISASLQVATVRFLNFEKGKQDGNMNRMFNICNVLHICMAIIILVLFESFGIWYIRNFLNIAPDKEFDAMFVFQVSTIACCLGIMNVPYSSLYNVHEKFFFPAVLSIINTLLKLLCVILLLYYFGNRLRLYALAMSLLTVLEFVIYHLFAYRNWRPIVKWSFVHGWKSYREMVSYTNYNMLSTVSMTARSQGSNLLINYFFGTIVNAAYGVATIVRGFVEAFMASFDSAAAPQITQNISSNNLERASYLANTVCRFCIILSELVLLPLYVEMDFILKIWLGAPPEGTSIFCRIMLLIALFSSTNGGIGKVITGSGKIKWFKIEISVYYLMCLPIGYLLFSKGFSPYWILLLFLISDILNRITQLILLRIILSYNVLTLIKEAYVRPGLIFMILAAYTICYTSLGIQSIQMRLLGITASIIVTISLVLSIGLKREERQLIIQKMRKSF